MDWRENMNRAIEYIEENLISDIRIEVAARYAGCSKWEFYRIFSFIAHMPLGEYIRRRRLSLALCDLQSSGEKIIDIALKYGYDSPAAFTRAFHQLYEVSPSPARKDGIQLVPYPKLTFTSQQKEQSVMKKLNDMEAYSQRGYYVKENAPVYFTRDIKKPATGSAMYSVGMGISFLMTTAIRRHTVAYSTIPASSSSPA